MVGNVEEEIEITNRNRRPGALNRPTIIRLIIYTHVGNEDVNVGPKAYHSSFDDDQLM